MSARREKALGFQANYGQAVRVHATLHIASQTALRTRGRYRMLYATGTGLDACCWPATMFIPTGTAKSSPTPKTFPPSITN